MIPMQSHSLIVLAALASSAFVAGQTDRAVPSSLTTTEGNDNNTIPFWSSSATYQQVHDDTDMLAVNNGAPVIIVGLGFRKDGTVTSPTVARTMDAQLTVSITPVTAATMTTNFATNLGTNTLVVFPYAQLNIPALTPVSTPNPVGFSIPFSAPYPFPAASGNSFLWELRLRNNTATDFVALDGADGSRVTTRTLGSGCIATGQTSRASIGAYSLTMTTGAYRNRLDLAPATTPTSFFLGVQQQTFQLPGLCSALELVPLVVLNGVTDATGTWDLVLGGTSSLLGYPQVRLLGQFVFFDAGLPLGLGLSNATDMTTPSPDLSRLTRLYAGPYQGGPGFENATSGSMTRHYGLVAILRTL